MTADEIRGRAGGVVVDSEENVHIVQPHGFVSRSMLRRALAEAQAFADDHPQGWWYVTDASRPVFPDPFNAVLLRRIKKLPNVRGYLLVAPSAAIRPMIRVWARIIGADGVFKDLAAARAHIAARG